MSLKFIGNYYAQLVSGDNTDNNNDRIIRISNCRHS